MDIDLGKCFCVGEDGRVVFNGHPHPGDIAMELTYGDQLIVEVASPTSFVRGVTHANVAYNLGRWAIWNIAHASALSIPVARATGNPPLVCPSDIWTRGYDVKTRHALAKAGAKNKDLRECEAMLWFHKKWPDDWCRMSTFLERIPRK